jgi:hypothetical protein
MKSLNLKKLFLYLLIASVAFSALMGIGVILLGNFGETESKILLTTFIITVTSILGLACGAYLETRRGDVLPISGIVMAIASAILWIIFTWAGGAVPFEKTFVKIALTTTLLAAVCSHISLLSIARLDPKFQWSLYAAHFADWSLTAILLLIIWADLNTNSGFVGRLIGILSIIIAALTIITPVFHKLSNQATTTAELDLEIETLKTRLAELEQRRAHLQDDAD